jgi:hypothetical protein
MSTLGRPGAGSGEEPGAVKSGRPDALAPEAFGLLGGDFGGLGQDLGEHAEKECSFIQGESRHDAPLDDADAGEELIGGGAAVGCDLDEDAATVAGVASMTASAVAAAWGMSKVKAMRRSSSPRRASPVRHRDAYASVQVVSPPKHQRASSIPHDVRRGG